MPLRDHLLWRHRNDDSSSRQPASSSPVQPNGTLITQRLILLPLEPFLQAAYNAVHNTRDPKAIRLPHQRDDGQTIIHRSDLETPGYMSMFDIVPSTSPDKRGWAAWLLEELNWDGDGDIGKTVVRGSDMPEEVQNKCVAIVGLQGWDEYEDRYNEGSELNKFWTVRVRVRDDKRRQGIGSEAYKAMIQALQEEDRRAILGSREHAKLYASVDHKDSVGAAFFKSLGFGREGLFKGDGYRASHFELDI